MGELVDLDLLYTAYCYFIDLIFDIPAIGLAISVMVALMALTILYKAANNNGGGSKA